MEHLLAQGPCATLRIRQTRLHCLPARCVDVCALRRHPSAAEARIQVVTEESSIPSGFQGYGTCASSQGPAGCRRRRQRSRRPRPDPGRHRRPVGRRHGVRLYDVPVFRLGRLAVDRSAQGRGLGGELLLAAGERALAVSTQVGGTALAIDAKDEHAAGWYERFGAVALLDDPLKLILPLVVIAAAIDSVGTRSKRYAIPTPPWTSNSPSGSQCESMEMRGWREA